MLTKLYLFACVSGLHCRTVLSYAQRCVRFSKDFFPSAHFDV